MSEIRKAVHRTTMSVRWGDMDAYGHVNNTVYFRYMEQARVEWIEGMGVVVKPGGLGPVIINASCTFLVPLTYPAELEVITFIGQLGRSSVETFVDIRQIGVEGVCATGAAKVVWMDTSTGKSVPIPEDVRAQLSA